MTIVMTSCAKIAATIAVIVASIISAVLLGLFDVLWQFLTDKIQNPTL